jgi:hypothetical protein
MKLSLLARFAAPGLLLTGAGPVAAEITRTTDNSFVSRNEVVVTATPKEVWLALISPADWWDSAHTWSGDATNLSLMPQAGGCFCETIPEVDEPGRFTLQGSVEHMRVVQAYPEAALRLVGSLGPLQSEPVTGVLTIVLSKADKGTRIVWEYNVGGPMRYEIPVISKAVDGVMATQLAALAKPLGVVALPQRPAPLSVVPKPAEPGPEKEGGEATPATDAAGPKSAPAPATKPAALVPAPATKPVAAPSPGPKSPSVEEAFGDLAEKPAAEPTVKPQPKP